MGSASRLFDESDRQAIQDAVAAAERTTSGEIVPVVASASGRYDRAESVVGVLCAIAFVWIGWNFLPADTAAGDWSGMAWLSRGPLPIVALFLAGSVAGNLLATWVPALRLPFTSKREMEEEVRRGAAESFLRFRVRSAAGGTGILLYVSLFEHRVVVQVDTAIAAKLSDSDWEGVRDLLLDGLKNKTPGPGFVAAIERCGQILAEHFPAAPVHHNELANELHILD